MDTEAEKSRFASLSDPLRRSYFDFCIAQINKDGVNAVLLLRNWFTDGLGTHDILVETRGFL